MTLTEGQLQALVDYNGERVIEDNKYTKVPEEIEQFKGWTFDTDTSKGSFDAEKGAMTDFPLTLTSPEGVEWVAEDGYYTNQGYYFYHDVTFEVKPKPVKRVKKTIKCPHCGKEI